MAFIQGLLGDDVIFSSVVKGNAYGHSIRHFCPIAYQCGVRHFSVFNAYEALDLSKCIPKDATIMIMGMIDDAELEWAVEQDIELFVFDRQRLEALINVAYRVGKPALVHLEIETGMNRTGLPRRSMTSILSLIEKHRDAIHVKGICTHFAGAESIANYKRVKDQYQRYKKFVKKLDKYPWLSPLLHVASSAASIRYPSSRLHLVRIGILQYGFFPSDEILVHYLNKTKTMQDPLKRIISWKSKVMEIKHVKAGAFVGYGTSYFTNSPTTIAVVPVGYANGYARSLSNQGKVLIGGRRLDVVGTVNMSMMAVNITGIDNVKKGDEVVLIGKQGDSELSVAHFGNYSNLVNYELLTRLPGDIPRIKTL